MKKADYDLLKAENEKLSIKYKEANEEYKELKKVIQKYIGPGYLESVLNGVYNKLNNITELGSYTIPNQVTYTLFQIEALKEEVAKLKEQRKRLLIATQLEDIFKDVLEIQ